MFGPALEAQLQAAWAHPPAFSAELRVLHPRRLDRDPLGRPLRDALHAYRRFRRKPARRDAARTAGIAPPARLRRRAEPRPHVHRLGRHSRRDHRGLDAAAGPAALPRRRRRALRRPLLGRPGRARDRPGRALSVQLPHPRPAGGAHTGAGDGTAAIMVLAFESADHPVDAWMARALECCADHGGTPSARTRPTRTAKGAAGLWRNAFIRMPYARERRSRGRSSTTRSRPRSPGTGSRRSTTRSSGDRGGDPGRDRPPGPGLVPLHPRLSRTARRPISPSTRSGGTAPDRAVARDQERRGDALIAAGGTITHHHAVGRDHRPWYDRQRPALFAAALRPKRTLDPQGHPQPGSADRSVKNL